MNTPKNTQCLLLSATIGNVNKVNGWMNDEINPNKETLVTYVDPKERFVPLKHYIYSSSGSDNGVFLPIIKGEIDFSSFDLENLSTRQKRAIKSIYKFQNNLDDFEEISDDTIQKTAKEFLKNFDATIYKNDDFEEKLKTIYPDMDNITRKEITELLVNEDSKIVNKIQENSSRPNYTSLAKSLQDKNMLPAIIFRLSKKQCENTVESLKDNNLDLTNDEEKEEIKNILDKYNKQNIYLGRNFDPESLYRGYAYHHAGELPQYRKVIEELFAKKLVKVVVSTSTLSAGINMPARTVVISDATYSKYNPSSGEIEPVNITASDFHQMAGRAGRRGIDKIGNVVFYNLFHKDYYDNDNDRADELNLAYDLLDSPADDLTSRFAPDWQMLAQFFDYNHNDEALERYIDSSFRAYCANTFETKNYLKNTFDRYKDILFKQDYLEYDFDGNITTTPKGKILMQSQGTNPLLLSELLFSEKLKDLSIEQIAQIAGFIAGSDVQEEDIDERNLIIDKFKTNTMQELNSNETLNEFKEALKICTSIQNDIIFTLQNKGMKPDEIVYADTFSGYIGYLWAHYNDEYIDNSIDNFRLLTRKIDTNKKQYKTYEDVLYDYDRKVSEGNVYKIISQSVSVLKQISKICEFALLNKDLYPNKSYWEDLKMKAELALLLVEQEPINSELAL